MTIEGFDLQEKGPTAGLLWVTFSNIQIHGQRGTPAYVRGLQQKAQLIDRFLVTELRLGTKHYNRKGDQLKTHRDILRSYALERGFFVDFPKDRRWKMEALLKEGAKFLEESERLLKEGGRLIHGQNQDRINPSQRN